MTVSVIIPTYNRAATIGRALESVFKQTVQDLEVIVVDDGSTDDTEQVVRTKWGDRIRFVRQENQGACVARNTGAELATGEFFAFLDSDDEWLPQKLEKQLDVFKTSNDPDLGVVVCARKVVYPGNQRRILRHHCAQGEAFESLIGFKPMTGTTTSAFLVSRRVFDTGVRFDPEQPAMDDWDFLVQASRKFSIRTVSDVLLINHKEDGGTHIHAGRRLVDARLRALDKYADDLRVRPKALARHHRGIAGSYRAIGNFARMRDHLRTAQRIDPSFTSRPWTLASYLGAGAFNSTWRCVGIINRGFARIGLPSIRTPF